MTGSSGVVDATSIRTFDDFSTHPIPFTDNAEGPLVPQQREYARERLGSTARNWCNLTTVVPIGGRIDEARLRRVARRLWRRHDALRMRLLDGGHGMTRQSLGVDEDVCLVDWSHGLTPAEVFDREQARRWDTTEAPLFRLSRHITDDPDSTVLFSGHHLFLDGVSLDIIRRSLREMYHDGLDEDEPTFSGFGAYADWLAELERRSPYFADMRRQWSAALSGVSDFRPGGAPSPADGASARSTVVPVALPRPASRAVLRHARRLGVDAQALLFACYIAALSDLHGHRDVTVLLPLRGRVHACTEHAVGFFANAVPIRVTVDHGEGVEAIARRLAIAMARAHRIQFFPFQTLAEIDCAQGPGAPLAFTGAEFNLLPVRMDGDAPDFVDYEPLPTQSDMRLQLVLLANFHAAGLDLYLSFRRALFDSVTMVSLLRGVVSYLECLKP